MSRRRVVVTGLGLVTPIGIGVNESWNNALNGVSGITKITKFDVAIIVDKNVAWLNVSVNDANRMNILYRAQNIINDSLDMLFRHFNHVLFFNQTLKILTKIFLN